MIDAEVKEVREAGLEGIEVALARDVAAAVREVASEVSREVASVVVVMMAVRGDALARQKRRKEDQLDVEKKEVNKVNSDQNSQEVKNNLGSMSITQLYIGSTHIMIKK